MSAARPSEQADVVIAGAGSAALAAAIAAHEHGAAKIVVLEKAPEPEFGGNPRFSHSGFRWVQGGSDEVREFLPDVDQASFDRMRFKPYTAEEFHQHIGRATRGRMDPVLQDLLVGESNAAMHWLLDVGLKWEPETKFMKVGDEFHYEPGYSVHPKDGGLGQLHMLRDLAEARGIEIRYESKVAALHGDMHQVAGVRVETPDGNYDLLAPSTILCAGGFQASAAARARYLGPNADLMKVRGSRHNTGEVLEMALALGAAPAGHWQFGHSSVVDANAPDFGILDQYYNRYSYLLGITVNAEGRRFVDEGSNLRMMTYARMGWITLAEPEGRAWQIYDQRIVGDEAGRAVFRTMEYEHAPVFYQADSIAELAAQLEINPEALQRTVDEYNASTSDDIPFDPTVRDGKHTVGLELPKSNWAIPIDRPPFVAYPVTAGITFTFGGVKINADAQVLNTTGAPIKGLYASGDIVGLFFHGYVGCTGQTRNVVFSRRAARHAVGAA
jgi:tricarballylate dehydrogenase